MVFAAQLLPMNILPKQKKKLPENLYHITFCNKTIELTNSHSILNSHRIKSALKEDILDFAIPTAVSKLANPICSKILNFYSFFRAVDIDKFVYRRPRDCFP